MDSRVPKFLFVVLAAYAAIHFSSSYSQLPHVVASHFDGHGIANGWQTKSAFLGLFVGVSALAAVIGFGIPRIIALVPMQLINLPNKRYWLAPQQFAGTQEFLENYFAWFGCAVFLVIILTFDYAVQFNLHPDHPPDPARFYYLLAGFFLFTIVWVVRMFVRFLRVPQDNSTAK